MSGAGAGSAIFGTCGFNRGVAEDAPETGDAAPESGDEALDACGDRGADFTGAFAELPVVFVAEGLEVTGLTLDGPAAGWAETGGFDGATGDFDGAVEDFDGATGVFHGVITGRFAGLKGPLSNRLPGAAAPFSVDVLTGGTDIFTGIRVEIGGATGGGDIGATVFGADAEDCLETLFD
jgi:hypothetical protein